MGDPTAAISSWAGGGAQTTLGAVQLAYGLYKDKQNKRPEYEIPPEIAGNLSMAQMAALEGLPAEQKQQFLNNIQRGSAYGMNEIGTRKGGLAGVAAINQQQNDAYGNLLSLDSQARQQNINNAMAQNQNMADYRDKAWQFNKLNKFYEGKAESQAMIGAGAQNVGSGLNSGAGATMDYGDAGKSQQSAYQPTQNYKQGVQMDEKQLAGFNQNTTPNPYGNQTLDISQYQGGSYW